MRCFNHPEIRAVGLCKQCNKALCHECANDLGFGLACRNVHEAEVVAVNDMVVRATQAQVVNRSNKYLGPLFFLVLGASFVGFELYTGRRGAGFGLWFGGILFVYGLYLAVLVRKTYSAAKA